MLRQLFLIILSSLALTLHAQSETFLDNLRKNEAGKAKVTVTQSAAIDLLVNGKGMQKAAAPTANTAATTTKPATTTTKPATAATAKEETKKPEAPVSSSINTTDNTDIDSPDEASYVDTRKKVMRNSYKMTGYRIQVFSGGNSRTDRQKAEKAGQDMKRYFPSEPVYVHFYSPSWKCRLGNYKSADEARRVLSQVKKYYPQACVVKGTISVQY